MKASNKVTEDSWEGKRLGRFTSSEIHKLMTEPRTKAAKEAGELSEGAKTYVEQKVAEYITQCRNDFSNMATEWGNEHEPEAALLFAQSIGMDVTSMDFVYCGGDQPEFIPYKSFSGGSPDIILPTLDAIAEIKCPFESKNHIKHLLLNSDTIAEELPEYYCQMQCNMLFAEKSKAYFISYDPRFPEPLNLKVIAIERNDDFLAKVVYKLEAAMAYRSELLNKLAL